MVYSKKVLRFEFSDVLIERVTAFANVHRYDDRKTYKEAWTAWLTHDEIAALLTAEIARLNCLGYTGDVIDKLFKSGRYYFRGKNQAPKKSTRTKYVTVSRSLLDVMDEHIERGVRSNDAYTPATGFADFWNADENAMLQSEIARLSAECVEINVTEKLKKTYKNRYFSMMKNEISANEISANEIVGHLKIIMQP